MSETSTEQTIENLKQQLTNQEELVKKLQTKQDEAEKEIESLKSDLNKKNWQNSDLKNSNQSQKRVIDDLKKDIQAKDRQIQQLEQKLQDSQQSIEEQSLPLKKKLEAIEANYKKIQGQFQEKSEAFEELERKCKELEVRNEDLKTRAGNVGELIAEKEKGQQQKLRDELNKLDRLNGEKGLKIEELKKEIEELKGENETLRSEKAEVVKDDSDEDVVVVGEKEDNQELVEAKQRIKSLEEQVNQLSLKCENLKISVQQKEQSEEELKSHQKKLENMLDQSRDRLLESQKDNVELTNKCSQLEFQLQELKGDNKGESILNFKKQKPMDDDDEEEATQEKLDRALQQIDTLEKKLELQRKYNNSTEKSQLEERLIKLSTENADIKATLDQYEEEQKLSFQRVERISELEEMVLGLTNQKDMYKDEVMEHYRTANELRKQLEEANKELIYYKNQIGDKENESGHHNAVIEQEIKEAMGNKKDKSKDSKKDLQKQISILKNIIEMERAKSKALEDEKQILKMDRDDAFDRITQLKNRSQNEQSKHPRSINLDADEEEKGSEYHKHSKFLDQKFMQLEVSGAWVNLNPQFFYIQKQNNKYETLIMELQERILYLEEKMEAKTNVINLLFGEYYDKLPSAAEMSDRLDNGDYQFLQEMGGKTGVELQDTVEKVFTENIRMRKDLLLLGQEINERVRKDSLNKK